MKLYSFFLFAFFCINVVGCATGPGVNHHEYFDSKPPLKLPFDIEVAKETEKIEVGAVMGEGSEIRSFIVGGLPAVAMLKIPGAVGAIRGKFAAGEAFTAYAKSLSNHDQTRQLQTLDLRLVYFQQYLIPGLAPRMEALLKFEAVLRDSGEVSSSGYVYDWEGREAVLTPGKEKDMLNEMMEQSLYHWATLVLDDSSNSVPASKFPAPKKGQFTGKGVRVTYEVFGKP